MLGKLVHIGFDALLISAFLAGIRRTTGLTYVCHWVRPAVLGTDCLFGVALHSPKFLTRTFVVSLACSVTR